MVMMLCAILKVSDSDDDGVLYSRYLTVMMMLCAILKVSHSDDVVCHTQGI